MLQGGRRGVPQTHGIARLFRFPHRFPMKVALMPLSLHRGLIVTVTADRQLAARLRSRSTYCRQVSMKVVLRPSISLPTSENLTRLLGVGRARSMIRLTIIAHAGCTAGARPSDADYLINVCQSIAGTSRHNAPSRSASAADRTAAWSTTRGSTGCNLTAKSLRVFEVPGARRATDRAVLPRHADQGQSDALPGRRRVVQAGDHDLRRGGRARDAAGRTLCRLLPTWR